MMSALSRALNRLRDRDEASRGKGKGLKDAPSRQDGSGQGRGEGEGREGGQEGGEPGGSLPGTEKSLQTRGDPTPRIGGEKQDSTLEGDLREGQMEAYDTNLSGVGAQTPSRLPYMDVFSQYKKKMEEALTKEPIPFNYREQVKEYFQSLENPVARRAGRQNVTRCNRRAVSSTRVPEATGRPLHRLAPGGDGTGQGRATHPAQGGRRRVQDYRPYVVGDDLRYVDWNIYSRLDKLLLKLYVEEEDLCLHLLVDGSASMGFGDPPKLEYALQVAAALGYIGLTNLERVALGFFSKDSARTLRPRRGRGQIFPLLEFLSSAAAEGPPPSTPRWRATPCAAACPGWPWFSPDLLDPGGYADGLKALLQHRLEVFLLHVVSEEELDPRLLGDLTLVDAESGATREVSVDRWALERYQERLRQHFAEAERFCARHRIDYLRTSTTVPFQELILRHLRRGGFLR